MYQPTHFSVSDQRAITDLLKQYSLATLVAQHEHSPVADHVPLLFTPGATAWEQGILQGHVARANPIWQRALAAGEAGLPALAIFNGPQAYVSPSAYPSKQEHGKVVPTWNYMVVHISGHLTAHDDKAWLMGFLNTLTGVHEAPLPKPWAMADAPNDYIDQMAKAIVGIKIKVNKIEAKFKLSQNRGAADIGGVIGLLEKTNQQQALMLASEMASINQARLASKT
jgi:transcriptional regulator